MHTLFLKESLQVSSKAFGGSANLVNDNSNVLNILKSVIWMCEVLLFVITNCAEVPYVVVFRFIKLYLHSARFFFVTKCFAKYKIIQLV